MYFYVGDGPVEGQRELAPGLVVDLGPEGVVGVEVLMGSAAAMGGLAKLAELLSEDVMKSIVFVMAHPPVPVGAQPASRRATTYRPVPTGESTFELTPA